MKRQCDAPVSRYEKTERRRGAVVGRAVFSLIRRRKIKCFIERAKDMPEPITEFDEGLCVGLGESLTVCSKGRIVSAPAFGMKIKT